MNIANGLIATDKVNVHEGISIGEEMAKAIQNSLPQGFYDPLKRTVTTMQVIKTGIAVDSKTVYDLETLYSRLRILSQQRSIDLKHVFSYELSPLPFSLFDEYGDMRKEVKASLMTKLAVYTTAAK